MEGEEIPVTRRVSVKECCQSMIIAWRIISYDNSCLLCAVYNYVAILFFIICQICNGSGSNSFMKSLVEDFSKKMIYLIFSK